MTNFYIYNSPIGYLYIEYTKTAITKLNPVNTTSITTKSTPPPLVQDLIYQLEHYFKTGNEKFNIPTSITTTPFACLVYEQLVKIPCGTTVTYKDIANSLGKPNACRAVGTAIGKNPIAIIVPCHRVIGSNGNLAGYAWGLDLKKKLLDLEQKNKSTECN